VSRSSKPVGETNDPGRFLPADATLAEAAGRFAARCRPFLVLTDPQGAACGVLFEEAVRLGLAGRARAGDGARSLAQPLQALDLTLDRDGQLLLPPPVVPRVRRALLMAGGQGARLRPLTDETPKPLLPVQGRPILHRLLDSVAAIGVEQVFISVHYLADKVRAAVGDGRELGLQIQLLAESTPLGTAGALGLLPAGEGPLLVMNGDILTDVNLQALCAWHARHGNTVTIATHLYQIHVPFGLAHFEGQRVTRLEEKPTLRHPVNAGIYLFEPELLDEVPKDGPFDMVTWLNALAARGHAGQFPIVERWHDLGSREEYERLR
jgi:dTDP-glucose pyrophosphorylase